MKNKLKFPLVQNFSGETDSRKKRIPSILQYQTEKEHRGNYLSEIWSLCFHTNGGFSFSEVYEMPIYMRRFFIKKTNVYFEEKAKAEEEAAAKAKSQAKSQAKIPRR